MPSGKVKSYDTQRGTGWIAWEEGEIFVHYSQILMDGYRRLEAGQQVYFEIVKTRKGDQAVNVRIIEKT